MLSSQKRRLITINAQRAQEIVDSPTMVNVTYQGTNVYIQNVDEKSEMARIYPLNEPEHEQTVPLHSLVEQ
jgi:small acid-soluble spore protein H (minor)